MIQNVKQQASFHHNIQDMRYVPSLFKKDIHVLTRYQVPCYEWHLIYNKVCSTYRHTTARCAF